MFAFTVIMFLILLGDDHVFEDSTLGQSIIQHMTDDALDRAGANDQDMANLNRTDGGSKRRMRL